jgi:hypothetical protein
MAPSILAFPAVSREAPAIVADPIGPAYRAELHRIGSDIHQIGGVDAVDEAIISIAVMDPTHSDWRAVVLESVWSEIGREAA